ncbi:MAG: carbon-nitrogen hydrolase family protein [bacterium]
MSVFAAIQMASGPQLTANLLQAESLITQAAQEGADFVVLPENFALMGHTEEDKLKVKEPHGSGRLQDFLAEQARKNGIWLCGGTIPLESEDPNKVYASSLVFNDAGEQVARYDKVHLFDVVISETEERYEESATIKNGGETVVFDSPFGKIGLAICYDLRFPELFRTMQEQGAEIFLLPAAFTDITGKAHWEPLLRARAIENLAYVVAAAQGGYHINGRATYGHSMIVDPWGGIVSIQDSKTPGVNTGEIKNDCLHSTRQTFPALSHRRL